MVIREKESSGNGSETADEVAAFNWRSVQLTILVIVYSSFLPGPISLAWVTWKTIQEWTKEEVVGQSADTYFENYGQLFTLWVVFEAGFLLYFLQRLIWFQRKARWQPLSTRREREQLLRRMLDSIPSGVIEWMSSWYGGAESEVLTRGDLDDALYILFNFINEPGADSERLVPPTPEESAGSRADSNPGPNGAQVDNGPLSESGQRRWREVDAYYEMLVHKDPRVESVLLKAPSRNRAKLMATFPSDACWAWPPALTLYLIVAALHVLWGFMYLARGYSRHTAGHLVYWYKPAKAAPTTKKVAPQPKPMVFFPGVGTGTMMYDMILGLVEKEDPQRPIFVVQIPGISMALSNWLPGHAVPPLPYQVAVSVEIMLANHGFAKQPPTAKKPRAAKQQKGGLASAASGGGDDDEKDENDGVGALFVAHSYGSLYASFVFKYKPHLVKGMVLAEPAAIHCHESKMVECFIFSLGPAGLSSPLSVLFRLEPHVSFTLRRHFDFNRGILFLEELEHLPSAVLVSKGDSMMASDSILALAQRMKEEQKKKSEEGDEDASRSSGEGSNFRGSGNGGGPSQVVRRSARLSGHGGNSTEGKGARDRTEPSASQSSSDMLTVEAFPPIRGEHCEHGTWCHDGPMNRIVFDHIQEVSRKITARKTSSKAD